MSYSNVTKVVVHFNIKDNQFQFSPVNAKSFIQMLKALNVEPILRQIPDAKLVMTPALSVPPVDVVPIPSNTTTCISAVLYQQFSSFQTANCNQVFKIKSLLIDAGFQRSSDHYVCREARWSSSWMNSIDGLTRGVIGSTYVPVAQLEAAIAACIFMSETPPWALDVIGWIQHGLLPLGYRGTHPHGVWYVMALPHASPEVVAEVAARPADLSRFDLPPVEKLTDFPDIAPVSRASWDALVGSPPPRERLLAHLGVYAQTPACVTVLEEIVDRVRAVEIVDEDLVLVFKPKHRSEGRLALGSPYRGPVTGLPRSLAAAMRCHGRAEMLPAHTSTITWYPYGNGIFHPEMDVVWPREPNDRDNPLGKRPLGVLSDGQQVWVLLPRQAWAPGEWSAACIDGETGALNPPLPFGIGGAFLRLIRWKMCPGGSSEGLLRP